MEFTITSSQLLGFCAFVTTVWNLYDRVVKAKKEKDKPTLELKKQVEEHEDKLQKDNEKLEEIEQTDKLILRSLVVIINHDITGNGIDQLKKARDEINTFLINK